MLPIVKSGADSVSDSSGQESSEKSSEKPTTLLVDKPQPISPKSPLPHQEGAEAVCKNACAPVDLDHINLKESADETEIVEQE